jgi:hypothetical protein
MIVLRRALQAIFGLVLAAVLYSSWKSPNPNYESTIGLSAISILVILVLGPWWPSTKQTADGSFLPNKTNSKKFCLALGVGAWAMALIELISPHAPTPTGRWAWLRSPIYENFGAYGLAVLWVVVGLILIAPSLKRDD